MTNKFDYQIGILQAAKEGKQLEWRQRHRDPRPWSPVHLIGEHEGRLFDFGTYEYRVKNEPEVLYLVEYEPMNEGWVLWATKKTRAAAEESARNAKSHRYNARIRKFVEEIT